MKCERVSCSECRLLLSPEIEHDEGLLPFFKDKAPHLLIFDFDQVGGWVGGWVSGCVWV